MAALELFPHGRQTAAAIGEWLPLGSIIEFAKIINKSKYLSGSSSMITRRTALAMFPASLMAGSSLFSIARAQPVLPIIKPNPNAAREIMARIDQTGRSPHQDATKALIESYVRIANLRISASDSRNKLNTKQDLKDALAQQEAMQSAVNIVIDSRKKTDDIIDAEKDPYGRRLSSADKSKLATTIIIKNNSMKELLTDLLSGSGDFDNRKVSAANIFKLHALAEDLLKAGRDLATWGPDTFYAMARGYATFQFIRYCIRDGQTGSSSILARAYTLKVIGDCESYFALRSASLTAPAPAQTGPTAPTGSVTSGQLSWTDRYNVEKDMIDKRFPKQIYLGSQIGRETRCESSGRRIKNYYGIFTEDSSFERGFRMDNVSASECTNTINDKGLSSLNNLLSGQTKFPGPAQGTPDRFRQTMRDVEKGLNDHIRFLRAQRDKENPQAPAPTPTTTTAPSQNDEVIAEFRTMQQMSSALREVLALT